MTSREIDGIDKGILYLLQRDARNHTIEEMGEEMDVAPSTVGSRLRKLEEHGVIGGYNPDIDYEKIGFDHHYIFVGTTPAGDDETVSDLMDVDGVVRVRELITNRQNVSIEVLGSDRSSVTESASQITELGVEIERVEMLKRDLRQPFNGFGKQFTDRE